MSGWGFALVRTFKVKVKVKVVSFAHTDLLFSAARKGGKSAAGTKVPASFWSVQGGAPYERVVFHQPFTRYLA